MLFAQVTQHKYRTKLIQAKILAQNYNARNGKCKPKKIKRKMREKNTFTKAIFKFYLQKQNELTAFPSIKYTIDVRREHCFNSFGDFQCSTKLVYNPQFKAIVQDYIVRMESVPPDIQCILFADAGQFCLIKISLDSQEKRSIFMKSTIM